MIKIIKRTFLNKALNEKFIKNIKSSSEELLSNIQDINISSEKFTDSINSRVLDAENIIKKIENSSVNNIANTLPIYTGIKTGTVIARLIIDESKKK